jgi:rhamnose utilization protein RhaD (predicted bifunctional aldolase and dehydrogenase)
MDDVLTALVTSSEEHSRRSSMKVMHTTISDSSTCAVCPPPDLVALAAHVGANRMWVQGAGGNVSAKVEDVLWVKGSGKWMSKAHIEPVFAALTLSGVRNRMAAGEADPATPELMPISPMGLRPSIETSMHALLPHPYVAHVHSVNVIAHSVWADGLAQMERQLKGLRWACVPYARPGVELTNAIVEVLQFKSADVLILVNHGLVIGGANRSAVEMLLNEVEARLSLPVRTAPPVDFQALDELAEATPYRPAPSTELHAMAVDRTQRTIAVGGSLYPDHVVFLGPAVKSLNKQDINGLRHQCANEGLDVPAVLLVPDMGVLLRRDLSAGALAMVDCLAMVLARLPSAAVRYLTAQQEAALLDWEAEKYRKSLSTRAG